MVRSMRWSRGYAGTGARGSGNRGGWRWPELRPRADGLRPYDLELDLVAKPDLQAKLTAHADDLDRGKCLQPLSALTRHCLDVHAPRVSMPDFPENPQAPTSSQSHGRCALVLYISPTLRPDPHVPREYSPCCPG